LEAKIENIFQTIHSDA